MARGITNIAKLELSEAAYDEIERKLLEAGHDHRFWCGPGSAIDMKDIWVEREVSETTRLKVAEAEAIYRKSEEFWKGTALLQNETEPEPQTARSRWRKFYRGVEFPGIKPGARYCFMCDEMVTQPCSRRNCLDAKNQERANEVLHHGS